jgi:transcriptional antiterminator RfaH
VAGQQGRVGADGFRARRAEPCAAGEAPEAWHVVATRRHRERSAQAAVALLGVPTYLPLLRQWPRPAVGADVGPMFPGYLFVQPAPRDVHRIARTVGVREFVTFGGTPARLDDAVIRFLRSREAADGVIHAEPLPLGSEVVITDGPLRGFIAVVERRLSARQRVLLLLDILQRQTRVELPEQWIRQA